MFFFKLQIRLADGTRSAVMTHVFPVPVQDIIYCPREKKTMKGKARRAILKNDKKAMQAFKLDSLCPPLFVVTENTLYLCVVVDLTNYLMFPLLYFSFPYATRTGIALNSNHYLVADYGERGM